MTDRYAVHFHCPLINYHERDGDPHETIERAVAHARLKAENILVTSVNKLKILQQDFSSDQRSFRISFSYTLSGKPTGAYIEVREVPKHQQSNALGHQEQYAGVNLSD